MRKLIVLPALAFALMLMVPGTAQTDPPLFCQGVSDFYPVNPFWRGNIAGDIDGWMEVTSVEGWDQGKTFHFEETWVIKTEEGGAVFLAGTDGGVVSPNSDYRANGVVTEAGPGYEHLIGRTVHMSGYITWDPDTGAPLTAPGTFRIN